MSIEDDRDRQIAELKAQIERLSGGEPAGKSTGNPYSHLPSYHLPGSEQKTGRPCLAHIGPGPLPVWQSAASLLTNTHRAATPSGRSAAGVTASAASASSAPASCSCKNAFGHSRHGNKSTEMFTTSGDEWGLAYSYDCSNFNGLPGNFIVIVKDRDAGTSSNSMVNTMGRSKGRRYPELSLRGNILFRYFFGVSVACCRDWVIRPTSPIGALKWRKEPAWAQVLAVISADSGRLEFGCISSKSRRRGCTTPAPLDHETIIFFRRPEDATLLNAIPLGPTLALERGPIAG